MIAVSVVVPVYNSCDTIGACIESIQQQTMNDWELVLVNDGSVDESGAICDDYASHDNRIRVIHQKNKGRSVARWVGTKEAQGEWIAYVDSDDKLPADSLSLLYAKATADTDIVLGNGYSLRPESRMFIPMTDFRHLAVRAEGTIGVPWGSLYRHSVLNEWMFDVPRHIYNGEDYLFWLRLVFSTERPVAVVYESVYDKGEEHTSNSFKWTTDYCYELNELRKASIPEEYHKEYMNDMIADRLENLFSVALWNHRHQWKESTYYRDIVEDMKAIGMKMPLKSKLYLSIPSRRVRQLYSTLSKILH